jgi:ABC-type lipoprotein release transport system permease subunit
MKRAKTAGKKSIQSEKSRRGTGVETSENELVFVVDVSRFTPKGFAADSSFKGEKVSLEFDEDGEGIFLDAEMARRIGAGRGDALTVVVEDGVTVVSETSLTSVGDAVRLSDSKIYYAIGREGGTVVRIMKA